MLPKLRFKRVEPFDFTGSGSVRVQQLFQISVQFRLGFRSIETLRFRFAPVKITSKPVYKVPVRIRSIIRKIFSKKKKKVFTWNRSPKFLFSSENHSVLQKKKRSSLGMVSEIPIFVGKS